jgi:hypothetical protein
VVFDLFKYSEEADDKVGAVDQKANPNKTD